MRPDGISVTEFRLDLPNTFYYLSWAGTDMTGDSTTRRHAVASVRDAARQAGWRLFAAGVEHDRFRLLFATGEGLGSALNSLLAGAREHRLCLVQAGVPLQQAAAYIHARNNAAAVCATDHADAALPVTHYGLFMGEAGWAERMLEVLTRCAAEAASGAAAPPALAEIARACGDTRTAIHHAYQTGGYTLKDIAEYFDMHFSEVSAVVNLRGGDKTREAQS